MKLSIITTIIFTLFLTSCTVVPKKPPQRVGSASYAKWQKAVLDKCTDRAAEVTLELVKKKYSEGVVVIVESDVGRIHKYLTEKCSRRSGITI